MADSSWPLSRYDAIIAAVPLAALAVYLPLVAVFDAPVLTQLAAISVGAAVVADGLFVHPPDDG
jgi:hypothetical protein